MIKRRLIPHPDNPLWMLVPLGGRAGGYAVVDVQDAEAVGQHNWYAYKNHRTTYARSSFRTDGKIVTLLLHRMVADNAGYGDSEQVDHENHDGLDCRRQNLRPATHHENAQNTTGRVHNTSGFKGVSWHKHRSKFVAQITLDGTRRHLGLFNTAEDAARAYDQAALRHFGPFAFVNFASANDNGAKREERAQYN